jgi:lipopolysaccharide transport system ATP-binding protein
MSIITVSDVSKQYRLGEVGTGSLQQDMNRWWHKLRGKEDPYLRVGESNDRSTKGSSDYVWALKDINFEVQPGEVLGIIGRNGAGKSTLLKILSRVTEPTTGRIIMNGRVASLLEVGTGFHPDLTGRENIYLNGAILGMTKREITAKFDEILDFAGVERYIDTPVKRYSSGMHVRLGFAVAAHLEPEILIVDEVLAVGDAEFQKKCLGKMKDVSEKEGRTVLFVSHNMGAIKTLCTRTIVISSGSIANDGNTSYAIERYLSSNQVERREHYINESPREDSDILDIKIVDAKGEACGNFSFDQSIQILTTLKIAERHLDAVFDIRVRDQIERNVFTTQVPINRFTNEEGILKLSVQIPSNVLVPNVYQLLVGFHKANIELIKYLESPVQFSIEETGTDFFQYAGKDYGCVFISCDWSKV